MKHGKMIALFLLLFALTIVITGCGGGGGNGVTTSGVAVKVNQQGLTLNTGAIQTFTATVTGSSNAAVTWSALHGSITSAGVYTAPTTAGTDIVTATSIADPTQSGSSTITVQQSAGVTVKVNQQGLTLNAGATQTFTATVTGSSNTAVTWSALHGSITSTGFYTAPTNAGTDTVTATSVADPTKSGSSNITIQNIGVTVTPNSTALAPSTTKTFTANVSGTTNQAVIWTASGGSITSAGEYTAPSAAGSYIIRATSQANPAVSSTATVTVPSAPYIISSFSVTKYTPGGAFTVTLNAVPSASNSTYGVLDQIPTGWVVSNMSDNGTYDSTNHMVKWVFLDATPRVLTYTITPPATASGSVTFAGQGAFDNTTIDTIGDRTISNQ